MVTTFPQTYLVQFGFHFDETQRLLELARMLSDDVYRARIDYSYASMHNTFVHMVNASRLWRNVIANTRPVMLDGEDVAGYDELTALFETERSGWNDLLATFDDVALLESIERMSPWGPMVLTIWQTLQHVILHGMQHHTELARMLSEAGRSPGDIDFLSYQTSIQEGNQ